jgi:uncharacterized protein (TIGR02757 family)
LKKYVKLKQKLEYHYHAFDISQIEPDPLQFLHLFRSAKDIETAGILASVFAYGNVKAIIAFLNEIFHRTSPSPFRFIKKRQYSDLKDLKYRFYTGQDIIGLFNALSNLYEEYGSIKEFFYTHYLPEEDNLYSPLNSFGAYMDAQFIKTNGKLSLGTKFMFPSPDSGSACKRMNLFLRWMIRKDDLDFGLWNKIPPSKLVIPVDTHIAAISQQLGLTNLRNVSWRMAVDITNKLKEFDPEDPVKYDFALCHIGIRKLKF